MALTLTQAETQARALTRHDTDTVRVTQTLIRTWLHHEYRALRTWLQDIAPGLYLVCSGDITVTEGDTVQLSSSTSTFERIYRVEYKVGELWRPFHQAAKEDVNQHASGQWTFREEGGCLIFGPDSLFSGTVRVKYYGTPPDLTAGSDTFNLPVQLEMPLILRTCGWIGVRDGDGEKARKDFRQAADDLLKEAIPLLRKRHGVHQKSHGLRRVMSR